MKKIISISLLIVFLFIVVSSIGCKNSSINESCDVYIDNLETEFEGISVEFSCDESYIFNSDNKKLNISATFQNLDAKTKTLTISDAVIVNLDNGVEYEVNILFSNKIELLCGIDETVIFDVTIPTSYKDGIYVFRFFANKYFNVYLFETPDELRADCVVKYVIDDTVVYQTIVKQGRTLTEIYIWDDPDNLYHCKKWYKDQKYSSIFKENSTIDSDLTLYGRRQDNIIANEGLSNVWVKGVNRFPASGILIIPSYSSDMAICITDYAIRNSDIITEVYLPKNIEISANNFTNMPQLKKIHYAGSKSEWNALQIRCTIPSDVSIIYNSTY